MKTYLLPFVAKLLVCCTLLPCIGIGYAQQLPKRNVASPKGSRRLAASASRTEKGPGGNEPVAPLLPQQRSWMFTNDRVDFDQYSTTLATSPRPGGNSAGGQYVAPAAYDETGQLLFSIDQLPTQTSQVGTLRDRYGNAVGTLNSFARSQGEIIIIPRPGSCDEFYVFNIQNFPSDSRLYYSHIRVAGTTPSILANAVLVETSYGNLAGIAMSKAVNGVRNLYFVSYGRGVVRVPIASTGVPLQSGVTELASLFYKPTEVELSPDGTKLAWGTTANFTSGSANNVVVANIDPSTGSINSANPTTVYTVANNGAGLLVHGLEFSADSRTLFVGGGSGPYPYNFDAVYALNLANGNGTLIANSLGCGRSYIELAYNGLLYAFHTSGGLYAINPNTLSTTEASYTAGATPITAQMTGGSGGMFAVYALPDQVDGENYDFFFGTPAPFLAGVKVAGIALFPRSAQPIYNCQAMLLTAQTSNAIQFQVTIQAAQANGTVVAGGYNFSTVLTGLPVDLRTLDNNYLSTATGYYKVTIAAQNACGRGVTRSGLINVNSLPTASFQFNRGDGQQFVPDPNAAAQLGTQNLGLDITGSTGGYTSFTITLEQISGNYAVILNNVQIAENTVTDLANINLNKLVEQNTALGANFFRNAGLNQTFRLTFSSNNPCGSSYNQVVGLFQALYTNFIVGINNELDHSTKPTLVQLFPNPISNEQGHLEFTLTHSSPVSLQIVNAISGHVRMTLLDNQMCAVGKHAVKFDGASLSPGVYIYRLTADKVLTGYLLKKE